MSNSPSARAPRSLASLVLAIGLGTVCVAGAAAQQDPHGGLALGHQVFQMYCSGCHGFDGFAFYPPAPSFSMGDRLFKSDALLMRSILEGRGAMPSWEDKLPVDWLEQALAYIRQMARNGNTMQRVSPPEYYFIFTPPGTDPTVDWRYPP